jgi:sulfate adenylyltransferase subunit 2
MIATDIATDIDGVSQPAQLNHLQALEAESIAIMREAVAEFARPVMLYSIGKDSSVMLRLAQKAFYPGKIPFPLLHVDTSYKFPEMIAFRDEYTKEIGADLIVHRNEEAIAAGANPYTLGTQNCCGLLKTRSLLDALEEGGFDAAFGGARRDEEKSRAKERVYSFRDTAGQWDPKNQRPELWSLYNSRLRKGESIRVFPLSNWTELDIWLYLYAEKIPIVPLYFAKERQLIKRGGALTLYREGMKLLPGEKVETIKVRMRSLGCAPCTGAMPSDADTLPKIIEELMTFRRSERENRAIDHDEEGSMETKKREGYF